MGGGHLFRSAERNICPEHRARLLLFGLAWCERFPVNTLTGAWLGGPARPASQHALALY